METKQIHRSAREAPMQVGGWVTVTKNKFMGWDKKSKIFIDGVTVDGKPFFYYLPKFKKSILAFWKHNLLNTDGRDFLHMQGYVETAANTTIGAQYIALTTDSGAAAAGNTTLTSEITTNGLGRAQATTITHTDNTNTTTLSKVFTASGTHTAVHRSGLFNATSSGIMVHEAVFASDATLVSGDTLTVTWTITLG